MNKPGLRQRWSNSRTQIASAKIARVMGMKVPDWKTGISFISIGSAFRETAESNSTARNPMRRTLQSRMTPFIVRQPKSFSRIDKAKLLKKARQQPQKGAKVDTVTPAKTGS